MIRIIAGSYFLAVSFGLPTGFDPDVMALLVLPEKSASLITSVVLFGLSVLFVLGIYLRATTLLLSVFLVLTSLATFTVEGANAHLGVVWQGIALSAVLMMSYAPLRPNDMHKAMMFSTLAMRQKRVQVLQRTVVPRRIRPMARDGDTVRSLRPLIPPTEQMLVRQDDGKPSQGAEERDLVSFDDPQDPEETNIFARF